MTLQRLIISIIGVLVSIYVSDVYGQCTPEQNDPKSLCICSTELRTTDPAKGGSMALKGYQLAVDRNDEDMAGDCLLSLGKNLIMIARQDSANAVIRSALNLFKENGHKEKQAQAWHLLGLCTFYQDSLVISKVYYSHALQLQDELSLEEERAKTLNNLGLLTFHTSQYDSALNYFLQSLRIKKSKNLSLASTLNNIGSIKARMNLHEDALSYYRQAMAEDIETKNKYGEASTLVNISNELSALERYDSAILNLKRAQAIFETMGLIEEIAIVDNNLASIYTEQLKLPELALSHFQNALQLYKSLNDNVNIYSVYTSLAEAYQLLNKPRQVDAYLDSAKAMEEGIDSPGPKYRYYYIAQQWHEHNEQFEEAYQAHKKYTLFKDSLNFLDQAARQKDYELLYQSQKANDELALLRKNQKITRLKNQLYLGAAIAATLFIITFIIYYKIRIKRMKALRETEKELNLSRQQLLQEKYKSLQLEKSRIETDLEHKRQELTNQALFLLEKEQLYNELREDFQTQASKFKNPGEKEVFIKLLSRFKQKLNIQNDRIKLREKAEPYLEDFHRKLEAEVPDITESEKRLASLLRSDLSSKEIATILGIEPKSVDMRRYRLRKKLDIPQDQNLSTYFKAM